MGHTGLEASSIRAFLSSYLRKSEKQGGAESGAVEALIEIIEAWRYLSARERSLILTMAQSVKKGAGNTK